MTVRSLASPPVAGIEQRRSRGRGRRPADEVRGEILDAAGELLMGEGMAGFTFERVSTLSGASRTTLHKWWPTRGALAAEAYFRTVETTLRFPDTGDITADLTEQLTAFVRLVTGTGAGRVIAELIGWSQTDPELAAAYRAAHEDYLRRRAELGEVPEIAGISAGGMPDRVKCLHVLAAHALAAGPGVNPLGDEVLAALPEWWSGGPCVDPEEGA